MFLIGSIIVSVIFILFLYYTFFAAPGSSKTIEIVTVPQSSSNFDMMDHLDRKEFIKNKQAFRLLMELFKKTDQVQPGGYRLSQSMDSFQILKKISSRPDLVWVKIGSCLRKEQIGEILSHTLSWKSDELDKWNTIYTDSLPEYFEGVYYPDTYLIPRDEPGEAIAKRLINRFNEQFAPYAAPYIKANIRWTTGLKIASLIAREAAGGEDMKLISGIIWNRLNIGMPLQIDATMQYTAGKGSDGKWWGNIDIKEKQKDSPYNSYLYKGLPPTPICNPSIEYIEAALNPEETPCLFYLHDKNKQIHCAKTYEEHLENITRYLE